MSRRLTDAGLSDSERDILKRREAHGWFVNVIAEDEVGPGFAYSFGLFEEFGHPEIIIFGLGKDTMQTLVNDMGNHIRAGTMYGDGERSDSLIEGYTCVFRNVNPIHFGDTFTWATWFYGDPIFPALQLIWPDKQGRFPWEPEFNPRLRGRQPSLDEPLPSHRTRID